MTKKQKFFITTTFVSILVVLFVGYIMLFGFRKLDADQIDHMKISYQMNVVQIDEKEDIQNIVNLMNDSKPIFNGFNRLKGIDMSVDFSDGSGFNVIEEVIIVHGIEYKVPKEIINELYAIYDKYK